MLNLASYIHSPDHSTKGTRSPFDGLSVLVSIRFQVLFTPLPGFFSPFLHSTVLYRSPGSIEAWRMVPPCSHRVSRVRRYSGYSWLPSLFAYETITLYGVPSHALLLRYRNAVYCPYPEDIATFGLASSVFARHYLRNLG